MMQPSKTSVVADWGAAASSVYTTGIQKGVELVTGGTEGVLEVHCIEDATDKWYLLPLLAGKRNGAIFDKIRTTNTTVTLSEITCFPI